MTDTSTPAVATTDDMDAIWDEYAKADAEKAAKAAPASDEDARAEDADDLDDAPLDPPDPEPSPAPEPAPKPTDAPPADKAAGAEKPAAPAPDIWANAPPEAKAAYDKLQGDLLRERNRTSALQKKYESRPMPANAQASAKDQLTDLKARREKMRQEYPELAENLSPVIDHLESQVSTLSEALTATRQERQAEVLDREFKTLLATHDDYERIIDPKGDMAPKLVSWINDPSTPRWIYEAAQRNWDAVVDGAEMTRLVTAFKAHIGMGGSPAPQPAQEAQQRPQGQTPNPVADRRQRQSEALRTPTSRSSGATVSGPPADDAPDEVWWEYYAKQDAAKAARR